MCESNKIDSNYPVDSVIYSSYIQMGGGPAFKLNYIYHEVRMSIK